MTKSWDFYVAAMLQTWQLYDVLLGTWGLNTTSQCNQRIKRQMAHILSYYLLSIYRARNLKAANVSTLILENECNC